MGSVEEDGKVSERETKKKSNADTDNDADADADADVDVTVTETVEEEATWNEEDKHVTVDSADDADVSSARKSSWFTPARLLVVFCVISMLNYIDRGAIASNGVNGKRKTCPDCRDGKGIQGRFDLSNFEDGVLSSAFMVGLLIASPIFANLAQSANPFRLIGVGLAVWTAATAGCGFSFSFWSIAVFRMLVGVGEASFISLAAPFIDDNAPPAMKTAWLGAFYMCIPTGFAIGYIYGGVVGSKLGWRWAFWIEALLMLPFAILGFVVKPLQLKGFAPAGSKKSITSAETADHDMKDGGSDLTAEAVKNEKLNGDSKLKHDGTWGKQFTRFAKDLKVLVLDKVFVVNVLGYITYNFVIGAYSYWGPKAGRGIYNMKNADMVFGGITVICGILGTIAGGVVLDFIHSTISNAFKLLSVTTFFGAICCFSSFIFKKEAGFIILFAVGEFFVFAVQAPVNFVCLHCVEPSLRPLSMAISTVVIHIFGDVPSAPLVGLLQDHIHNWRKTALILTSILSIPVVIWCIGIFLDSTDKFYEDSINGVGETRTTSPTPLHQRKTDEETTSTPVP